MKKKGGRCSHICNACVTENSYWEEDTTCACKPAMCVASLLPVPPKRICACMLVNRHVEGGNLAWACCAGLPPLSPFSFLCMPFYAPLLQEHPKHQLFPTTHFPHPQRRQARLCLFTHTGMCLFLHALCLTCYLPLRGLAAWVEDTPSLGMRLLCLVEQTYCASCIWRQTAFLRS